MKQTTLVGEAVTRLSEDNTTRVARALLQFRLEEPGRIMQLAQARRRPVGWGAKRLVIIALDHPARRVLAAGGDDFAMANRTSLLLRLSEVLRQPGVDGLLATPDIMEELIILNHIGVKEGDGDFLDGKILVGSMNRGGLANTAFELDDFVSAYTPRGVHEANLDAGKLLFRLNPDSRDSSSTMRYCVDALNGLDEYELPCFLEPLVPDNHLDNLVRLIGVATGMGNSSRNRWLKLPMLDHFNRVAEATTCPIVLLGGSFPGTTEELRTKVQNSMAAGPNVRGLMIGRGVLYPSDGADPVEVAKRLAAIVHEAD